MDPPFFGPFLTASAGSWRTKAMADTMPWRHLKRPQSSRWSRCNGDVLWVWTFWTPNLLIKNIIFPMPMAIQLGSPILRRTRYCGKWSLRLCGSESLQAGQVVKSTCKKFMVCPHTRVSIVLSLYLVANQHGNGRPGLKCWSAQFGHPIVTWGPHGPPQKGSQEGPQKVPMHRWIISWARSRSWPSCNIPSSSTCPGTRHSVMLTWHAGNTKNAWYTCQDKQI